MVARDGRNRSGDESGMTSANEIQHGGQHYKGAKIQHWDFIVDNKIGYLEGCASKYLSRHKMKNGLEDILKAEHYVQKILEKHLQDEYWNTYIGYRAEAVSFCDGADMDHLDTLAFCDLITWKSEDDLLRTLDLIAQIKAQYPK